MNNKITGKSLYPDMKFGQFRFLNVLYRMIQTKLLQEPVFAHCALLNLFKIKFSQDRRNGHKA